MSVKHDLLESIGPELPETLKRIGATNTVLGVHSARWKSLVGEIIVPKKTRRCWLRLRWHDWRPIKLACSLFPQEVGKYCDACGVIKMRPEFRKSQVLS